MNKVQIIVLVVVLIVISPARALDCRKDSDCRIAKTLYEGCDVAECSRQVGMCFCLPPPVHNPRSSSSSGSSGSKKKKSSPRTAVRRLIGKAATSQVRKAAKKAIKG